jgi:hypothetical protein
MEELCVKVCQGAGDRPPDVFLRDERKRAKKSPCSGPGDFLACDARQGMAAMPGFPSLF